MFYFLGEICGRISSNFKEGYEAGIQAVALRAETRKARDAIATIESNTVFYTRISRLDGVKYYKTKKECGLKEALDAVKLIEVKYDIRQDRVGGF